MSDIKKEDVINILKEIAFLLQLKGENFFKIRAYEKAANMLETTDIDLKDYVEKNKLKELDGIGKALAQKITEYVNTGKLEYYEKLKESIPDGLIKLLKIPGLGPGKISKLHKELNVNDLHSLKKVCKNGSLAKLKGFSEKTANDILGFLESHNI